MGGTQCEKALQSFEKSVTEMVIYRAHDGTRSSSFSVLESQEPDLYRGISDCSCKDHSKISISTSMKEGTPKTSP